MPLDLTIPTIPTQPSLCRRGGYMECVNFPEEVKEQLYKLASICLCPNLSGQICMVSGVAGGLTGALCKLGRWWMSGSVLPAARARLLAASWHLPNAEPPLARKPD